MNAEIIILTKAIVAALLGAFIGYERRNSVRASELRATTLVAMSSTLFIILGHRVVSYYLENVATEGAIEADPARVISAVVTGISFIGAGVILKETEKKRIMNLTIAGTILAASVIGIAVAVDMYITAIGVTLFVLIINRILGKAE